MKKGEWVRGAVLGRCQIRELVFKGRVSNLPRIGADLWSLNMRWVPDRPGAEEEEWDPLSVGEGQSGSSLPSSSRQLLPPHSQPSARLPVLTNVTRRAQGEIRNRKRKGRLPPSDPIEVESSSSEDSEVSLEARTRTRLEVAKAKSVMRPQLREGSESQSGGRRRGSRVHFATELEESEVCTPEGTCCVFALSHTTSLGKLQQLISSQLVFSLRRASFSLSSVRFEIVVSN